MVGGDNHFAVKLHEGEFHGDGTGGYEDTLRLQGAIARWAADEHLARLHQATESTDDFNVTLLQQGADTHVELGDDFIFIGEHRRDIEGELFRANEPVLFTV